MTGMRCFRWWRCSRLPKKGWSAPGWHCSRELGPGVYEVEFCDDDGKAYAMVALKAEQLMRLHHEPANQAA